MFDNPFYFYGTSSEYDVCLIFNSGSNMYCAQLKTKSPGWLKEKQLLL